MNFFSHRKNPWLAQMDARQLKERLNRQWDPYLLDVRQPEEFQQGHIPGSVLIPLDQLPARMQELPREREIVCICRSGSRSGVATRQLNSAGFNATNLQGGMISWTQAGLPVERGVRS